MGEHVRETRRSPGEWLRDWRRLPRPSAWRTLYASNLMLLLIVLVSGVVAVRDLVTGHASWWTALEGCVFLVTAGYLTLWLMRPLQPREGR